MDQKSKNEIVGRLWLWAQSISMTQQLLGLAFRANIGKNQDTQINERDNYIKNLNEFVKNQPDYKPDTIFSTQQIMFDNIYYRPYPTWNECISMHDACVELAIVYFCQILNDGYHSDNSSASNSRAFRDFHFPPILKRTFKNEDEFNKFEILKKQLTTARDKMIGHADGDSYSIQHGNPVSTIKGSVSLWREIDFGFWSSFLETMRIETYNYTNLIKLDLTAPDLT